MPATTFANDDGSEKPRRRRPVPSPAPKPDRWLDKLDPTLLDLGNGKTGPLHTDQPTEDDNG